MGLVQMHYCCVGPTSIFNALPLLVVCALAILTWPIHADRVWEQGFWQVDAGTKFWFCFLAALYAKALYGVVLRPIVWLVTGR